MKNEPVEPSGFLVFTVTLVKISEAIEFRKSYCFYQLKMIMFFAFRGLGTFPRVISRDPTNELMYRLLVGGSGRL